MGLEFRAPCEEQLFNCTVFIVIDNYNVDLRLVGRLFFHAFDLCLVWGGTVSAGVADRVEFSKR